MEIAPNPERLDFETNINSINRTTSTMIFAGVTYIQPRGKEIYKLLHKAMSPWRFRTSATGFAVKSPS